MFCLKRIINRISNHTKQFIILIRHAEKHLLPAIDDNQVSITNIGKEQAYNFGKYLRYQLGAINEIKTSPVQRCVQTAEIFASCFSQSTVAIRLSTILVGPGPYIIDDKQAAQTFKQHSVYEVINKQLAGKRLPGIRDAKEGTQLLIDEIKNDMRSLNYPIIYISHDVILAAFIGSLINGLQLNEAHWVDYLNGVCISYDNNILVLHTESKSYEIK